MTTRLTPASLTFRADGTPFCSRHDDVYHSTAGALAQARYVFLRGNGLPERWRGQPAFRLIETGFGMGINFLATWFMWRNHPHRSLTLQFVSIEKHPFSAEDLRRAHAAIIDDASIQPLADELISAWPPLDAGVHRLTFDSGAVVLTLIFCDIADAPPLALTLDVTVDAIYLDGFAPRKNPDMWSPATFAMLARLAAYDATFATYTSAGLVKRALLEHGFEYRKTRGFAGKRAMLTGKRSTLAADSHGNSLARGDARCL
ncbi:tRNA (5-methylaminomethyl-2-thiouridine)(34)-methyltransferase MnmD [Caballeronia sp. LZ062]|nr:tRNA (5-methylaminomethyl-2-thiouridine)(34)-methyltransferase MnmD [Caballeronia sp. LZ050]MDR5873191.1 tRNA (5-methylaminomethyl-2-thiouridine)(34)-methyltransferase MnmD [Caballeronia sp. LZ062]